ncbi:MAG: hypothetical protein GF400_03230 [Candidatus Eisenbacteria bacterium]|nr:hypothetical protein [Candidatus Eisenbacteria bacterium]
MTDSGKKAGCVIVAHGNVADCMMDAIQGILGKQTGWMTVSNRDMGLKELNERVSAAVSELSETHEVIIFTDMPGGSCHHACRELAGSMEHARLVTGLNLMMLLEFFVKREHKSAGELLNLVIDRGRDSVRLI